MSGHAAPSLHISTTAHLKHDNRLLFIAFLAFADDIVEALSESLRCLAFAGNEIRALSAAGRFDSGVLALGVVLRTAAIYVDAKRLGISASRVAEGNSALSLAAFRAEVPEAASHVARVDSEEEDGGERGACSGILSQDFRLSLALRFLIWLAHHRRG